MVIFNDLVLVRSSSISWILPFACVTLQCQISLFCWSSSRKSLWTYLHRVSLEVFQWLGFTVKNVAFDAVYIVKFNE